MFTGIVKDKGTIVGFERVGSGAKLRIRASKIVPDANIGDSVAIDGVCLTVTFIESDKLSFDLSGETLQVTTLGELKMGDNVNLEPSLRPIDYVGGHFVSGHVEGIGSIAEKTIVGKDIIFKIKAPRELMAVTISRGSICVDGISLTVTKVWPDAFEVVIIPHTGKETTMGSKSRGDKVNLEADLIARYIKRIMETANTSADVSSKLQQPAEEGF